MLQFLFQIKGPKNIPPQVPNVTLKTPEVSGTSLHLQSSLEAPIDQ